LLPANTQRIRKVVILDFLLAAGAKKRGGSSVDEFALELTDAVVPVRVFANIYLCDAAGSFLFAGYSVVIRSGRRIHHNRMFWSREDSYFGWSPVGCGLLNRGLWSCRTRSRAPPSSSTGAWRPSCCNAMPALDVHELNIPEKIFNRVKFLALPEPCIVLSEPISAPAPSIRYDEHVHDALIAWVQSDN